MLNNIYSTIFKIKIILPSRGNRNYFDEEVNIFLTCWPKSFPPSYLLSSLWIIPAISFEAWRLVDCVIPLFTLENQNTPISWLRVYLHWGHRKDTDIASLANKLFSQNCDYVVLPRTFERAPVQMGGKCSPADGNIQN